MRAPMGAQSFPKRLYDILAQTKGGGCVRVTYRMMPEVRVFAEELQLFSLGDPNFDKGNEEDARKKTFEGIPIVNNGTYFKEVVGGIPDVVYFQGGILFLHIYWKSAVQC